MYIIFASIFSIHYNAQKKKQPAVTTTTKEQRKTHNSMNWTNDTSNYSTGYW